MNIVRQEAQVHRCRKDAGGWGGKCDYALTAMLFLVTLLAPLRAAAEDSIALPSLPEGAAAHAVGVPPPPAGSPGQARREPLPEPEVIEEPSEPFIADDVRTAGRMYAAAEIITSIVRSPFLPTRPACQEPAMSYLIELRTPACPTTYVLAQAESGDSARALVDAQLGRDDAYEDAVIVAVHSIH